MTPFTFTDITVGAILLYCLYSGWVKGIVRILIGPFTLGLSIIVAIIYFRQTHNISYTLLILLLGPFFLSLIWRIHSLMLKKSSEDQPSVSLVSRTLGMLFNAAWGLALLASILFSFMLIPLPFPGLQTVQKDIGDSYAYAACQKLFQKQTIPLQDVKKIITILKDSKKIEGLQTSPEFQKITQDPLVIKITQDEHIIKQIQTGDIIIVIKNPDIQALMKDKELMKKLLELSQQLLKDETPTKNKGKNP